jgi:hypothetical protein
VAEDGSTMWIEHEKMSSFEVRHLYQISILGIITIHGMGIAFSTKWILDRFRRTQTNLFPGAKKSEPCPFVNFGYEYRNH